MIQDEISKSSTSSSETQTKKTKKTNAATGASAASVRALGSQAIAFYFRAPVKAFFRTRVDYLASARALRTSDSSSPFWRLTTPALLSHAVKTHGWSFIPNQVLPPLAANIAIGAVLYTSYLQILGTIHPPSAQPIKRIYPPPSPYATFIAGAAAGGVQSLCAAPVDAVAVRWGAGKGPDGGSDGKNGKRINENIWSYSARELRKIGIKGVFKGFGLSVTKDTLGFGLFFSTFEYIKAQACYKFIMTYHGDLHGDVLAPFLTPNSVGLNAHAETGRGEGEGVVDVIKPHFAIEPAFLALAGMTASLAQQAIAHPLGRVQDVHFWSITQGERKSATEPLSADILPKQSLAKTNEQAVCEKPVTTASYRNTWAICKQQARKAGGWWKYLYTGFWWSTIRQVPSTAAGLVIFELVRKRYANEVEAIRIEEDGYDILLV